MDVYVGTLDKLSFSLWSYNFEASVIEGPWKSPSLFLIYAAATETRDPILSLKLEYFLPIV